MNPREISTPLCRLVMRLLESVNARGTTVLVTTHDHQLLKTFQKVLTLAQGRLIEDR